MFFDDFMPVFGQYSGELRNSEVYEGDFGATEITIVPVIPISFEGAGAFRDDSGLRLGHDNGSTLPCPELLLEQTPVRWARSISVCLARPFSLIQLSSNQLSARRLYGWRESSSVVLAR